MLIPCILGFVTIRPVVHFARKVRPWHMRKVLGNVHSILIIQHTPLAPGSVRRHAHGHVVLDEYRGLESTCHTRAYIEGFISPQWWEHDIAALIYQALAFRPVTAGTLERIKCFTTLRIGDQIMIQWAVNRHLD